MRNLCSEKEKQKKNFLQILMPEKSSFLPEKLGNFHSPAGVAPMNDEFLKGEFNQGNLGLELRY